MTHTTTTTTTYWMGATTTTYIYTTIMTPCNDPTRDELFSTTLYFLTHICNGGISGPMYNTTAHVLTQHTHGELTLNPIVNAKTK